MGSLCPTGVMYLMKDDNPPVVTCNHCELVMKKTDDGYACRTIGCGKGGTKGEGEFIMEQDEDGVFLIRTR